MNLMANFGLLDLMTSSLQREKSFADLVQGFQCTELIRCIMDIWDFRGLHVIAYAARLGS